MPIRYTIKNKSPCWKYRKVNCSKCSKQILFNDKMVLKSSNSKYGQHNKQYHKICYDKMFL